MDQEIKAFIVNNFSENLNGRGDIIKPISYDLFFDKINSEYPNIFLNHMKEEKFGQWKGLL